jgi:hypothetical protein
MPLKDFACALQSSKSGYETQQPSELESLDRGKRSILPILLLHGFHSAKPSPRVIAGLGGIHPDPDIVLRLHFQVEAKFVFHLTVQPAAKDQPP